ncbi:hypothetical protein M407DRAFT_53240, partial [Tulasnella calospora MUT 4182]
LWTLSPAVLTARYKSFANELSLMAELRHPNVASLVAFVEDIQKGDAWIVLPWEPNGNVQEFLQLGKWDIPERISLIQDVVKGVVYLHTREPPICHGDLKSLNILVDSKYHAVITDFGSAQLISQYIEFNSATLELTLTGPGYTIRWTAPEVLREEDQGLPSDMWAVGWICWEIVTGKIPFEELPRNEMVIARVVTGKLPAIREEPQLSHVLKLCGLMSDCWISDPAGR